MPTRLPSPSGARISGDDYQHLYTWTQALKLLRESDCVARIAMEARDAGNVDDVVVYRRERPNLFHQVKFVVDHRQALTHEWFTDPADAKRSPLQRFYDSYTKLSTDENPAELALVTNRPADPDDPVLKLVGGRSGNLGQRLGAAAAGSKAGKIRRQWAEHIGTDAAELLDMLTHLEIQTGEESFAAMRRSCAWLMEAVRLRGDQDAIDIGIAEIRRLVAEGCEELDADALREIVAARQLAATDTRATLLVQAIDHHPWPEAASASVDWVSLFAGNEPRARRQLHDPALWNTRLAPELRNAVAAINRQGYKNVLVEGALRLSTWFLAGTELTDLAGYTVALNTRDGLWATNIDPEPLAIATHRTAIDQGKELAVALSLSGDATPDVSAFLHQQGLPVKTLLNISPANGPALPH
jgi:SMODS-associated and fused to various effectors sensor domain